MSLLTSEHQLPSVEEFIHAHPELQSEELDDFFEKFNLSKTHVPTLTLLAKGRSLTYRTDKISHPFAYFTDNNGDLIIVCGTYFKGRWDILTLSEKSKYSMCSGIVSQVKKYDNAPEFVNFVNFASRKVLNYDYRSNDSASNDGEEFYVKGNPFTIRFHGKKTKETDETEEYKVFITTGLIADLVYNKANQDFELEFPI